MGLLFCLTAFGAFFSLLNSRNKKLFEDEDTNTINQGEKYAD